MKKLFVLFLLVSIIPFAAGCRAGGIWGPDDDPPTGTLSATVAFPETLVAGNVLPSVMWDKLTLQIGVMTLSPLRRAPGAAGGVIVTFEKRDVPLAIINDLTGNREVTLEGIGAPITFTLALGARSAQGVAITVNVANGVVGVTAKVGDAIIEATDPGVTDPTGAVSFKVTSVTVGEPAITIGIDQNSPATIASLTPTFRVTFNREIMTPLTGVWTVAATNLSKNPPVAVTFTEGLVRALAVANDSRSADVTIVPNATHYLEAGTLYSFQLLAPDLRDATGTLALSMPHPTFYFKTAEKAIVTVAGTAIGTDQANPVVIASSTFTVTFDEAVPINLETAIPSIKDSEGVNIPAGTHFVNDNNVVVFTVHGLQPEKSYSLQIPGVPALPTFHFKTPKSMTVAVGETILAPEDVEPIEISVSPTFRLTFDSRITTNLTDIVWTIAADGNGEIFTEGAGFEVIETGDHLVVLTITPPLSAGTGYSLLFIADPDLGFVPSAPFNVRTALAPE